MRRGRRATRCRRTPRPIARSTALKAGLKSRKVEGQVRHVDLVGRGTRGWRGRAIRRERGPGTGVEVAQLGDDASEDGLHHDLVRLVSRPPRCFVASMARPSAPLMPFTEGFRHPRRRPESSPPYRCPCSPRRARSRILALVEGQSIGAGKVERRWWWERALGPDDGRATPGPVCRWMPWKESGNVTLPTRRTSAAFGRVSRSTRNGGERARRPVRGFDAQPFFAPKSITSSSIRLAGVGIGDRGGDCSESARNGRAGGVRRIEDDDVPRAACPIDVEVRHVDVPAASTASLRGARCFRKRGEARGPGPGPGGRDDERKRQDESASSRQIARLGSPLEGTALPLRGRAQNG